MTPTVSPVGARLRAIALRRDSLTARDRVPIGIYA